MQRPISDPIIDKTLIQINPFTPGLPIKLNQLPMLFGTAWTKRLSDWNIPDSSNQ